MWPYLETEVFQSRYAIAAHFLKDYDQVIELGGYNKCSIDRFMSPDKRIVVISPTVEGYWKDRVHRVKGKYPENDPIKDGIIEFRLGYGVVVLGLEMHLDDKGWDKFLHLLKGAKRVVLGTADDHIHSVGQFRKIMETDSFTAEWQMHLDFSPNYLGENVKSKRTISVLKPK